MRPWPWVCSVAVLGMAHAAAAHEFVCDKTVNGSSLFAVTSYPTTLHYAFTVTNSHPTDTSIYTSASDPLLPGFGFEPPAPHAVAVGQSVTSTFDVTLTTAEECFALAASDGTADGAFDNTFTVTYRTGIPLSALGVAALSALTAHYIRGCEGCGCGVTANKNLTRLNRQGVQLEFASPQQLLGDGRTGIDIVDQFIHAVTGGSPGRRQMRVLSPDTPKRPRIWYGPSAT